MAQGRDLEDFLQWERAQNSLWANIKKTMSPLHMVALLWLLVAVFYLIERGEMKQEYVYFGALFILGLILLRAKKATKQKPIPENVIKKLAGMQMRRKIGGDEYPSGTQIFTTPHCGMRYEGEWGQPFRPWKWEVGIKVLYPNGLIKYELVCLEPYEGYITKIVRKRAGYDGEESNDLKILLPQQLFIKEEGAKPSS